MAIARAKTNESILINEDNIAAVLQLISAVFNSPNQALQDDIESGRLKDLIVFLADGLRLEPPQYKIPNWSNLQSNYVQLFLTNPSGLIAPPYLAYAIDNKLLGPSFKRLKDFYSQNGLIIKESYTDFPDHISAVAQAALLLLENGNTQQIKELGKQFFLPWFERYKTEVLEAEPIFYGPICQFCETVLRRVID